MMIESLSSSAFSVSSGRPMTLKTESYEPDWPTSGPKQPKLAFKVFWLSKRNVQVLVELV